MSAGPDGVRSWDDDEVVLAAPAVTAISQIPAQLSAAPTRLDRLAFNVLPSS
jgi:hypothetical protein